MPRSRSDPSLNLFLPPGVRFRPAVASYQFHLNLLGRHTRNGQPRYVGSWPLLEDVLTVRDSTVLWLRYRGEPPKGFRHWCSGFSGADPVPFLVQSFDFGRRCLAAREVVDGCDVPESLPGLRALALGQLPKPVRLF